MQAEDFYPGFKGSGGLKWYPDNIVSALTPVEGGNVWFVDGDKATGTQGGKSWEDAFTEAQFDGNISALGVVAGDVVYVAARTMVATDTDPVSYTTNLTVNVPQVSIIGVSRGRTQGGLPQLKVGATTTQAIIRVRAPGVQIVNLGINGASATGGGIRFDDDGGTTYASFGGSVLGCHFKNCKGTSATNAATGGAVQLSGSPWQMHIAGNRFYKNVGGIVLLDTSNAVPQDVVIEHNTFSGEAASVDCDIYGAGGSGFGTGLTIFRNRFEELPALGSGSNVRWLDLTGGDGGIVAGNFFGEDLTHGAAGTGSKIPTTINFSGNYDAGGLATTS